MNYNRTHWVHRKLGDDDIYYDRNNRNVYRGMDHSKINESEQVIYFPSYDPTAPLKVYFDPSYYCNLKCRHCITNSSANADRASELPTERIITILDELAAAGVVELSVGGGEPLCYPDLYLILKCMVSAGLNVVLDTNGTLVTPYIAASLADIGLSEIRVSFEGGQRVHESIRGYGVYQRAMEAVIIFTRSGLTTVPRITLCKGSEIGLDQLFSDLALAGVKAVKVSQVKTAGRASLPENQDLLGYLANITTVKNLKYLGKKYSIKVRFPIYFPVGPKDTDGGELRSNNHRNCGAGFETVYISPFGDMHPCSSMPQINFGDLAIMSFMDAWTSNIADDYRHRAIHCGYFQLCDLEDGNVINKIDITGQ